MAFSFFFRHETSAANLAMGGGDLCHLTSPGVVFSNPASLGSIQRGFLHSSYKSYYNIEDLTCYTLTLAAPYKSVGVGVSFESFGERSFYREQEVSLSIGVRAYRGFCVGVDAKHLRLSIETGRFSHSGVTGDLGVGYDTGRGLLLGLCLRNILTGASTRDEFDLQSETWMGIGLSPYQKLYFSLSYSESEERERWYFGQELSLTEYALLRCGLRSDPTRYTVGVGLGWRRFALDLAYQSHPVLEATSQVDLRVDLFSRERK